MQALMSGATSNVPDDDGVFWPIFSRYTLGITGVAKAACMNAPLRAGARRSAMRKGQGLQAATL